MRIHLLIFIFLFSLVVFLHYLLDSSYLDYGMHSDDWISLVRYKALEVDIPHKIQFYWRRDDVGPHATSQVIYIGLLESMFGLNYKVFALINIILKILATLSLYPLIYLVFKRRLLAFLVVVLYSISYSTVGTLHLVIKGTEYQAIFFMNIFLMLYYFITKKRIFSLKWYLVLMLSFPIAILFAPPRLFPLILAPLLIEIFLWIHMRANYNLKLAMKKLFFLYLPFILLFIYSPIAAAQSSILPIIHLQKILEGYWYIILSPLSGLGYMIFWGSYWAKLIGTLSVDNFGSYLLSLVFYTSFVFGLISIILALFLSKNRKSFIFLAIVLNFIMEIFVFFLATNHLKIPTESRVIFDFNTLYSVFVGVFILVFSINCYIEWLRQDKKNNLLLAIWVGPLTSFYFIFCNWLFANPFLAYVPSHEYLTIPAIGVSLMFAALLTFLYDKIKAVKVLHSGGVFAFSILLLFFIPIYSINKTRAIGYIATLVKDQNASQQQDIQRKIREQLKTSATDGDKQNKLVFFDWTKDKVNGDFYSEIIYSSFTSWMHYNNGKIVEGCINQITDKIKLANSITERSGKKGFILPGVCVETPGGNFFINQEIFYELRDFYAFEINNNNLSDVRVNILKDIGIN